MKIFTYIIFAISMGMLSACTDTPQSPQPSQNFQTVEQVMEDINKHGVQNIQNSQAWQEGEKHIKTILGDNPSDEQIYAYVSNMVTQTNVHLPLQVDEITTLMRTSNNDRTLTYHMKIHQNKDEMNFSADMMKDILIHHNNVCGALSAMLSHGIWVDYHYHDENETPVYLIHIRPEDCS